MFVIMKYWAIHVTGILPLQEETMGQLHELSKRIDDIIAQKGLDRMPTRGKIGLKSGILMAFNENTPDDNEKIMKIKEAAREVLGVGI